MPKVFTSEKQKTGKLGEDLAKKFLISKDYTILEENYTKKYGEIDLIAKKDSVIHFVEVKSVVSHETKNNSFTKHVSHETGYDPIQNVHLYKIKRISRVIQVYLLSKDVSNETKWQFDVILVNIDQINKIGKVKHIKDIII